MAKVADGSPPDPREEISWAAWYNGLGDATKHSVRYRYSVAKARRLVSYASATSPGRHLAVVFVYFLPGLVASLIPTFVVLQDPLLGAIHTGFFLHGTLTTLATFSGGMLQARAVTSISHGDISTLQVVAIAVVSSVQFWVIMGLLGVFWRFPVPFTMVLGSAPYVFQILFYPIYSTLFEAADQRGQVVLIALFPVCKHYIKRAVAIVSYQLGDFWREVSVAGVEICASIYQATIMQNTPSIVSGVLIVLVDVLQGFIDVRRFLAADPGVFARALAVLQDASNESVSDTSLASFQGSKKRLPSPEDTAKGELTQTLETLQSLETILLVEYLETLAPVVNTVYLVVASQLPSAVYNPRVREFHGDHMALTAAVLSVAVYSLLQAATLVAMCWFVSRRFQFPALALLAFVLETHAWSLQGKLVAWFTYMFAFSVVHYGVDFSFNFDFAAAPHA